MSDWRDRSDSQGCGNYFEWRRSNSVSSPSFLQTASEIRHLASLNICSTLARSDMPMVEATRGSRSENCGAAARGATSPTSSF
jgi:hypothetical protein